MIVLKHRLAAILAAVAAGYSRLMADDHRATVEALDVAANTLDARRMRFWIGVRLGNVMEKSDAPTGNPIWAEKYDHVLVDIFALQEELTRSIVAAIAPHIDAVGIARMRLPRPGIFSAFETATRVWATAQTAFWRADRDLRVLPVKQTREALAVCDG